MEEIRHLMERQSISPGRLGEPAPDGVELSEILSTAMSAPDHGALKPWRFVLIKGSDRESLGKLYAEVLKKQNPHASEDDLDKARRKPLRAPLVIAVITKVTVNHPKAPPVEQIVATAMATQNILNALHIKGYGGILLTGAPAYDSILRDAFLLKEEDVLIGFIYVGTPVVSTPGKTRSDVRKYVTQWPLEQANS